MKKFLVLATLLAVITVSTQAAVVRWASTLFGGNDNWTNGLSWTADAGATPYGSEPLATDSHALIGTQYGTVMPTINTVIAEAPNMTGIGWDNPYGELNIVPSGSYSANNVIMGFNGNADSRGVLNMSGGYMVVGGTLSLGHNTASANSTTGTINQSAGILHLNAVTWNNGVVNLSGTAWFLVNGDQTGLDLVGNGWITAPAGKAVVEFWNEAAGRTEYTVVPEPATLGLLAILGLAFLRRK